MASRYCAHHAAIARRPVDAFGRPIRAAAAPAAQAPPTKPARRKSQVEIHADDLRRLRDQGLSVVEIGKRLGIGASTANRWLVRAGLPRGRWSQPHA